MSDEVSVQLDALTEYARVADQIASAMEGARAALVDAGVTVDSFGMLPESREVHTAYDERCRDGLDLLSGGGEVFSALGDVFRDIRVRYETSDAHAVNRAEGAAR
ncbi:hypothetical protein ACNTMW_17080 [Planosporangium sp. 12N6]|uniref:hypothetical protein n=1 Tax=Planosporangium spinosum TaxID=3402278 RepID=UPI003CEFBEDC